MAYNKISTCGGLRYSTSDFTEVDKVITEEGMLIDVYEPTYSTGVTAEFDADKYADTYGEEDTTFTATVVAETFVPSYSTGVSATFDAVQYKSKAGTNNKTFTASLVDAVLVWMESDTQVNIADYGFTSIDGADEGAIISVAYTSGSTSWSDGTNVVNMADVGLSNIAGVVNGSTIKIEYDEESVPRTELVGDPFVASMCGGIKLDDGVFAEVGKVITTVGTTSVSESFRTNCGLLFDASKFELGDDKEICLK